MKWLFIKKKKKKGQLGEKEIEVSDQTIQRKNVERKLGCGVHKLVFVWLVFFLQTLKEGPYHEVLCDYIMDN